MSQAKAIFLDRDGVILKDLHLISDLSMVDMYLDVGDAIAKFRELGFKIFLVTNQAVVARGIISFDQMLQLNNEILTRVKDQNRNAIFDDVYICPHHPNATLEAYRKKCDCRKPSAGMLTQAAEKHGIDLTKSIIIGDRLTDIYAGKSVGCKGFQLLTGAHDQPLIQSTTNFNQEWLKPDMTFENLQDIATYLGANK